MNMEEFIQWTVNSGDEEVILQSHFMLSEAFTGPKAVKVCELLKLLILFYMLDKKSLKRFVKSEEIDSMSSFEVVCGSGRG